MNHMRTSLLLVIAAFPVASLAEGYTNLVGKLDRGREIVVDMEPPAAVWVWKRTRDGAIVEPREYREQGCELVYDTNPKRERRILTCSPSGITHLAGTKYVGKRVKGRCEDGGPEFRYVCVSGCGKRSHAPGILTQNYWECE